MPRERKGQGAVCQSSGFFLGVVVVVRKGPLRDAPFCETDGGGESGGRYKCAERG
jgi:hypothetical protein